MHQMLNVNKFAISIIISLTTILLLLFVSVVIDSLMKAWPQGFTRPANGNNYFFLYFILLWCFLFACYSRLANWSRKKQIIIGIVAGQIISMAALVIVTNMYFDNPLDRLANSINNFGIITTFIVIFIGSGWRSIFLGGWLFGMISILLIKILQSYSENFFLLHSK